MDGTINGKPALLVLAELSKRKSVLDEAINAYVEKRIEERCGPREEELKRARRDQLTLDRVNTVFHSAVEFALDAVRTIKVGDRFEDGRFVYEVMTAPRVYVESVSAWLKEPSHSHLTDDVQVRQVPPGKWIGVFSPFRLLGMRRVESAPAKKKKKTRK